MIYKITESNTSTIFYIDVPKDIDQNKAINVILQDRSTWKNNGTTDLPDNESSIPFAEFIHPNLFIHEEDDQLLPDMKYFELIDEDFFEKMIYHWSKVNDLEVQEYLDKIDDNKDYIISSFFVIDILE